MREGEIRDASISFLAAQSHNNYYDHIINSRMAEYNSIQRLEEQLGSTQNSLSSLEGAHEEVSLGAKRNGRMSVVRRFFCLFVLFDLLLISLIWLLCLMLMGSDKLIDILKMQVLHYNITTSIFDIVNLLNIMLSQQASFPGPFLPRIIKLLRTQLAAFCRFTILLLFYGLLQVNTTFFVALTTLATCMFLIVKVIYYSWNTASQPVFQVIPVLISFVIAWAEAWFLDFRVLPQELSALTYAQATGRFSESLSTLLLDRNLRSPVMRHFLANMASQIGAPTESNGNFYSPVESTNVSSDDSEDYRTEKEKKNDQCLLSEAANSNQPGCRTFAKQDRSRNYFKRNPSPDLRSDDLANEYLRRGKDALEVAWSLLNDCDWKLQKTSPEGDSVYSKHEAHLGKVFLLRAKINISAQKLLEELFVNIDKLTLWNKTIIESRRLMMIDKQTDITYQVSSPAANGVISSRDFVNLRHWDLKGDCFVLAGISIPYPDLPPSKSYIRGENGPCCWVMRSLGDKYDSCSFEFLLNTNLKGWIPQYALDAALTSVLLEYSSCLREYCKTINKEENT